MNERYCTDSGSEISKYLLSKNKIVSPDPFLKFALIHLYFCPDTNDRQANLGNANMRRQRHGS